MVNTKPQTYGPTMDSDMVPSDTDEWIALCSYDALVSDGAAMQTTFNNAINFAIDDCDTNTGGIDFLTLWREGCWPEIREDFPEFIEKYGVPE